MKKPAVLSGMEIWALVFTGAAALVSLHWRSLQVTLGVLAGGLLMAGNLIAIKYVVRDLMGDDDEKIEEPQRKRRKSWVVVQYVVKMLLMLAVIGGLLKYGDISAMGMLAGISSAIAALLITGLRAAAFEKED